LLLIGPGPRWLFYSLLLLASLVGLLEFYKVTSPDLPQAVRWCNGFLTAGLFATLWQRQVLLAFPLIVLWALAPMVFFMLGRTAPKKEWTSEIAKATLGPVYVVLPLALLVMIDLLPTGNLWIFYLLTVVFTTDTGAFYFGRLFGKHRLHEAISPNKTWEGALGGLMTAIIAALFFLKLTGLHRLDGSILVLTPIMSIAGQVGDLLESMLKRNHGIKDSGLILPGHGGLLDRIDGLLFAIPVLFIYLSLYVG
jgi:phosphatidate cytidylyltransferase